MTASKNKPPAAKTPLAPPHGGQLSRDNLRETIESIAIAFVLAFLFRTFEAEAFVIPTGSMAPTLMGQHTDARCVRCGIPFRVGEDAPDDPFRRAMVGCSCPNCRYTMEFGKETPDGPAPPSFRGDRIIVAKFPYEIEEPKRWDVAVFRYPMTAKMNYIKRIVGLPQETLQIFHGDILTRPEGSTKFEIQHKPPSKVQAMMQVVYDNDYVLPEIIQRGWPARWQATDMAPDADSWTASDDGQSFSAGPQAKETWLRYRHFVPSAAYWNLLKQGPLGPAERAGIRPQWVTDFYAYNTGIMARIDPKTQEPYENAALEYPREVPHWVGDLALECELNSEMAQGEVILELTEGGRQFRCLFDLATGTATLSAGDSETFHPQTQTTFRGPGRHRVMFANVDDKLYLWIDGEFVRFDRPTSYDLGWHAPTDADRAPAGIAARGTKLQVHHLRLWRDIYYIADMFGARADGAVSDYDSPPGSPHEDAVPTSIDGSFPALRPVEFTLAADQFLVLGDNSPRSKDSRLWPREHYVQRELLIGKAIFVFWPHALDHLPGTRVWFPWFPNFGRMRFIR